MCSRERTQRKMQLTAASVAVFDTLMNAPREDGHFGISLLA